MHIFTYQIYLPSPSTMFQCSFKILSGLRFQTKPTWNPRRNLGDHPHYVIETGSQDFISSWLGQNWCISETSSWTSQNHLCHHQSRPLRNERIIFGLKGTRWTWRWNQNYIPFKLVGQENGESEFMACETKFLSDFLQLGKVHFTKWTHRKGYAQRWCTASSEAKLSPWKIPCRCGADVASLMLENGHPS